MDPCLSPSCAHGGGGTGETQPDRSMQWGWLCRLAVGKAGPVLWGCSQSGLVVVRAVRSLGNVGQATARLVD